MRNYVFLSIFALTAAVAADHPALGGTWVLDASHSDTDASKIKAETLSINQQPESVQLAETITGVNGKETSSEISCNTGGETCKIKDRGQAEVWFWYNNGVLVMSEIRHGNDWEVRRRLKLSDDGRTLTMEVIHLAPAQKPETLTFTRSQTAKSGGD
jgi:hypothetical protein